MLSLVTMDGMSQPGAQFQITNPPFVLREVQPHCYPRGLYDIYMHMPQGGWRVRLLFAPTI